MNMIPSTRPAPARAYARFESYVLNVLGDGIHTCDTDSPIEGIAWDARAAQLHDAYIAAVNAKNGH